MTSSGNNCQVQTARGVSMAKGKPQYKHFRHRPHGGSTTAKSIPGWRGSKISVGPNALGDFRGSAALDPAASGSPSIAVRCWVESSPVPHGLIRPCSCWTDKLELRGPHPAVQLPPSILQSQAGLVARPVAFSRPRPGQRDPCDSRTSSEQTLTASALKATTRTEVIDALSFHACFGNSFPGRRRSMPAQNPLGHATPAGLSTALPSLGPQIGNQEGAGRL